MKKYKNLILMLLILPLTLISKTNAKSVDVHLPTFDIYVNEVKVENDYKKYPFIVYKGITYFPLTYDDAKFMGWNLKWIQKTKELHVVFTEQVNYQWGDYKQVKGKTKNKKIMKAKTPEFKIKFGDEYVPKMIGKYPVLVYNDVTYLPLVSDYYYEDSSMSYVFSKEKGLEITRPEALRLNTFEKNTFNFDNGSITYYENANIQVYYLDISYKGREANVNSRGENVNLGVELTEKLYPNNQGANIPSLINKFWSEPRKNVLNKVDIFVKDNIAIIPLAQDVDGKAVNSVVKIDMDELKILNIKTLTEEEVLNYNPEKYLD